MPLFDSSEGTSEIKIWIDGGCNPNPGKGTIGIYSTGKFKCGLCLSKKTTNNQMEYIALYGALKIAEKLKVKKITIYTDSKILATTFNNKNYTGGANKILHNIRAAFVKKASELPKVSVQWVPRESNTNADELTNLAYDNDVWDGLEEVDKIQFISDLVQRIV